MGNTLTLAHIQFTETYSVHVANGYRGKRLNCTQLNIDARVSWIREECFDDRMQGEYEKASTTKDGE